MVKIGNTVIYGANGVFRIEDLREERFGAEARQYYVLRALSARGGTTIFVPADNEALLAEMHPLLSPEELIALIRTIEPNDEDWPKDTRGRSKYCKELLTSGKREELIRLVKILHRDAVRDATAGKKTSAAGEAMRLRAEQMLYDEFSLLFDMREEDVLPFLLGEIDCEPRK